MIAEFALLWLFWGEGAEFLFWQVPGVFHGPALAMMGRVSHQPPPYEEGLLRQTGPQRETVRVVYDPAKVSYQQLLKVFWGVTTTRRQGMASGQ